MSEDPALPLPVEEAAYAAELRDRVRALEDHLNAIIDGTLPEGTRFEWPLGAGKQ